MSGITPTDTMIDAAMDSAEAYLRTLPEMAGVDGTWREIGAENPEDLAKVRALFAAVLQGALALPLPMVLHCPRCGAQHIDGPDPEPEPGTAEAEGYHPIWTNPPHRSHLCHQCRCIWRPADVPTNGVAAVATAGKADTWPPKPEAGHA